MEAALTDPVSLAKAVCADWNSGMPWENIYAALTDYDPTEAAYYMAISGEAYCPSLFRYMNRRLGL